MKKNQKPDLKARLTNFVHDTLQAFRMAAGLPYGHYSLSSNSSIKLSALPEPVKRGDYYRFNHPRDLYEVVSLDGVLGKIVVRSLRTGCDLSMTTADFEEMFKFHAAFVSVGEHVEVGAPHTPPSQKH